MARSSWRSGRPTPRVSTNTATTASGSSSAACHSRRLRASMRALLERRDLRVDLGVALLRDALDERGQLREAAGEVRSAFRAARAAACS